MEGGEREDGPVWGAPSAFFAFATDEEPKRVAEIMMEQDCLGGALPGGRLAAADCVSVLEVVI